MADPTGNRGKGDEATKRLRVRDAVEEPAPPACIVTPDASVADVAECFKDNPGVNTAPVVDTDGRLLGIIPMRLLLNDLFLRIAPVEFLADLAHTAGLEEFGRISRAETAGELMERPAFVTHEDDAREAFALMHERKIEGLPIVDSKMKVVGYLDRLHLIRLWLTHYGAGD